MATTLIDPRTALSEAAAALRARKVAPFLGPGISALAPQSVPMSPETLADWFGTKVALPKRARGNAWAAAQHIESYKHRNTVTALMGEAFAAPVPPSPLHRHLATLGLPLIVDTWYTGEMRQALAGRDDWIEVQGITRAGIGEDRWFRFYGPDGQPADTEGAERATTLVYTPHGSVIPALNFLISDADYVEVLTEIDIQTPIPDVVRDRRRGQSFLFLGCRFNDQLLRSYARQIIKRSIAPHFAVIDVTTLTRNERAFLDEQDIMPIDMPLGQALEQLIAG
ncbi:MAG: SIR2 family protein [Novosphingobium sp.]|nr:SIR2 family protein [Novosphingobium sp.]